MLLGEPSELLWLMRFSETEGNVLVGRYSHGDDLDITEILARSLHTDHPIILPSSSALRWVWMTGIVLECGISSWNDIGLPAWCCRSVGNSFFLYKFREGGRSRTSWGLFPPRKRTWSLLCPDQWRLYGEKRKHWLRDNWQNAHLIKWTAAAEDGKRERERKRKRGKWNSWEILSQMTSIITDLCAFECMYRYIYEYAYILCVFLFIQLYFSSVVHTVSLNDIVLWDSTYKQVWIYN